MQIDQNSTFGENGTQYTVQLDATKLTSTDKIRVYMGGNGKLYESDSIPCGSGSKYYDNGDRLLGDSNLSGGIYVDDATLILKYIGSKKGIAASEKLTIDNLQAMDVNDSGGIYVDDATAILKYIAGNKTQIKDISIKDKEYLDWVDTEKSNLPQ